MQDIKSRNIPKKNVVKYKNRVLSKWKERRLLKKEINEDGEDIVQGVHVCQMDLSKRIPLR